MESWQIYHVARKKLTAGVLQKIYRRSSSLVNQWAADPSYCETVSRNPLDRIRIMLEKMDNVGAGEYARAAIDYMAKPLGGRFAPFSDDVFSDKGTIEGEAMDALCALGRLTDTVRDAVADGMLTDGEVATIKDKARTIKAEVDQLLDAAGIAGGV